MKRFALLCFVGLAAAIAGCGQGAEGHNAANQILEREKQRLQELTEDYESQKALHYEVARKTYVRNTKEHLCSRDQRDQVILKVERALSSARERNTVTPAWEQLMQDMINKARDGYALLVSRGLEFDRLYAEKGSAIHRQLEKRYEGLKVYEQLKEQQVRFAKAKER